MENELELRPETNMLIDLYRENYNVLTITLRKYSQIMHLEHVVLVEFLDWLDQNENIHENTKGENEWKT